ncbi:MAG: acyltransferase [Oscillibacter sp.]|nr:acyltransferase [Oscillibacter sp.]
MKRIGALDLARVIAMLCVILIHVSSAYIDHTSGITVLDMNLAFLLNQAARFSVPLFLLLSGVSLGLQERVVRPRRFYVERLRKIGIPYLLWSGAYYLAGHGLRFTAGGLLRALLLGQSAAHLYFIVILFQLYLLYPFLRKGVERSPGRWLLAAFLLTYLAQTLRELQYAGVDLVPSPIRSYLWLSAPSWLFYFVLGMVLDRERLRHLQVFAGRNRALLLSATAILAFLHAAQSRAAGTIDAIRPSLNVLVPLSLLSVFSVWEIIEKWQAAQKAITFWARHAMTIYFSHIFVLRFFRQFPRFDRGMSGMLLLYGAVVAAATAVSVVIDGACRLLFRRARPS